MFLFYLFLPSSKHGTKKGKHCILKILDFFLKIVVIKDSVEKGDSMTVFVLHNCFEITDA